MSDTTTKEVKKKSNAKWTRAQALGFWFLLTAVSMFWTGIYLGGAAAHNSINEVESAKTQAVEEYKAQASKE